MLHLCLVMHSVHMSYGAHNIIYIYPRFRHINSESSISPSTMAGTMSSRYLDSGLVNKVSPLQTCRLKFPTCSHAGSDKQCVKMWAHNALIQIGLVSDCIKHCWSTKVKCHVRNTRMVLSCPVLNVHCLFVSKQRSPYAVITKQTRYIRTDIMLYAHSRKADSKIDMYAKDGPTGRQTFLI